MPGPRPKPTALRLLEGNLSKRPLPKNEPKPRPITPDKPRFGANKAASSHWDRLAPVLEEMGCLTEADGDALRLLCLELATVDLCERRLCAMAADELVYDTSNGSQAPTAWLKQRREASKAAESWMARLGLTPADRTKIEVKKPDASSEDPVEKAVAASARRR